MYLERILWGINNKIKFKNHILKLRKYIQTDDELINIMLGDRNININYGTADLRS